VVELLPSLHDYPASYLFYGPTHKITLSARQGLYVARFSTGYRAVVEPGNPAENEAAGFQCEKWLFVQLGVDFGACGVKGIECGVGGINMIKIRMLSSLLFNDRGDSRKVFPLAAA
jgi:hypothetical protein